MTRHIRSSTTWQAASRPLVIGHRGASADAPENTLAAFALAKEQGADGIELDVHLSLDGWPVVIHDQRLERTTNGHGRVQETPLAELKRLDAGNGETIPTLDEVFALLGRRFFYNVELKQYGWQDGGLATAVAERIKAYRMELVTVVSSFNPFAVRQARWALPADVPVAAIRMKWAWMRFSHLIARGEADHPHYKMVDGRYMAWAKREGYLVNTWTVDDPDEARRLAALGVTGIITNRPRLIRETLAQRVAR